MLVSAAEGVDDFRLGKALLGVPDVVGELDVFDNGAVFVFAPDRSNVHAQQLSM
jgi:hypothetical protein